MKKLTTTKIQGLSIIIPTLNEAGNIKELIQRIHTTVSPLVNSYEIVVVDDNSVDNTILIIKELEQKYPIRFYSKRGERGKATSLLEGFSYASYDLLCMIDADLQYIPEAIEPMLNKIQDGADVVVANRKHLHVSLKRKIASKLFLFTFGRLLHNFSVDVQSGLKIFRKQIIERVELDPLPWTFDLEFLVKARSAGYVIEGVDVVFQKRKHGEAKINLLSAAFQGAISAVKVKFAGDEIIPFTKDMIEKEGYGFHFKGNKYIHHTALDFSETAFFRLIKSQSFILIVLVIALAVGIFINWHITVITILGILSFLYFSDLVFNLFLIYRSFSKAPEVKVAEADLEKYEDKDWPMYTILCPLYKEWQVVPQFVSAISELSYPHNKLQVMLVLEEDDKVTIDKVRSYNLPSYFEIVIVPHSYPKTKPKACNYALAKARGEYVVIYDAEDIPEPLQLKKAIIAFEKLNKKTVCIQAKLNFYNPHQNILTRVFTAEYSLWFDLVLTGLQSIQAPIPLGGTSNHFKTANLIALNGWDSFNVTEDCDLGIRLIKRGFRTAIIDSITHEEANSDILNWFAQRNRWIKGYLQTYLVHMRNPRGFVQSWKQPHAITFQLVVGGKIFSMFINPLMWATTISYFIFRPFVGSFIESFFPAPIFYMAVLSLVFGNFLYMYYYMIGCAKREHYDIIKYVFLVPFYWLCMSIAAYQALYSLIRKPHYWAKTKHGLHFKSNKAVNQATSVVGRELVNKQIVTYPLPLSGAFAKGGRSRAEL